MLAELLGKQSLDETMYHRPAKVGMRELTSHQLAPASLDCGPRSDLV
jgi:hypothetical protein